MNTPQQLTDITHVGLDAAESQWIGVQNREPHESLSRQVPFVAIEVVLCHAASLLVDHRRFGSSTNASAPEPIQLLSLLFRRPPSSVLAKMANLDGTRPNGARFDRAAGVIWEADRRVFDRSYAAVVLAARRNGVSAESMPDFLVPNWPN